MCLLWLARTATQTLCLTLEIYNIMLIFLEQLDDRLRLSMELQQKEVEVGMYALALHLDFVYVILWHPVSTL